MASNSSNQKLDAAINVMAAFLGFIQLGYVETDMQEIQIDKSDLQKAMRQWAEDHRSGECRSHEEADALPIEQLVAEQTEALWAYLTAA